LILICFITVGSVQVPIRPRSGGIIRRDIMESAGAGRIGQAIFGIDYFPGAAPPPAP
jgi:hypothetical protein